GFARLSGWQPVGNWVGCVEPHEPEGLTGNANRVAVQHLNLARLNRRSVRARRGEGQDAESRYEAEENFYPQRAFLIHLRGSGTAGIKRGKQDALLQPRSIAG